MTSSRPPKITVLSCSYNRAPFIAACANSILRQKFDDWEWLIHDDGSTDGTYEYLQGIKDPRVRLRRGAHRGYEGVIDVHNDLLKEAKGEWIAFIDSDDMWMPDRLEKQLPGLSKPGVVLSHGDIWLINEAGEFKRRLKPHADPGILTNAPIGSAAVEALATLNFPVFATPSMVRRSALLNTGGFVPGTALWDYSLFLNLSLIGAFDYVPAPLACWRRHGGQITMTSDRIPNQYRAHLDYARAFLSKNEAKLRALGLKTDRIQTSQEKTLRKVEEYEALMRAHSFLDIGAWSEARRLYAGYLKLVLSGRKQRETYFLPALVGLFSSYLRVNGVLWASKVKNKMMGPK